MCCCQLFSFLLCVWCDLLCCVVVRCIVMFCQGFFWCIIWCVRVCPGVLVHSVLFLARAVGVPVSRRTGGQLATTLVATINVIIFFHFFCPSRPFLIEGVFGSKNLLAKVA